MTLRDGSVNIDFDGDPTNDSYEETARGLAQWAVNVVDFRDADAIMTPFEFDINPIYSPGPDGKWGAALVDDDSNGVTDDISEVLYAGSDDIAGTGWNVDGILGTVDDTSPQRGLVWGCERPEMLIKETLAFHDRRTEDLSNPEETTTRTDGGGI